MAVADTTLEMNADKLKHLQESVRIGGKVGYLF